jgi:hypothetical protein
VSDADEPTQIPVDTPQPDASERVEMVSPVEEPAPYAAPSAPVGGDVAAERPELLVAGAFAGAFVFAKLLQRIGGNR